MEQSDVKDRMTKLQVLTLVAIATLKENRNLVKPEEHFSVAAEVDQARDNPIPFLQELLLKEVGAAGLVWDGKVNLWQFLIDANRDEEKVTYHRAVFGVAERRKADADEILRYNKIHPRVLSREVIKQAEEVAVTPLPEIKQWEPIPEADA